MSVKSAFIGTGADSPWVDALYEALGSYVDHRVVTIRFQDFRVARRPNRDQDSRVGLTDLVVPVPPAYATRLHWLTRGFLTRTFSRIYAEATSGVGAQPFLILTNPAIERWTRSIPDERLIYWNFDDYRLFQPDRVTEIETWEAELIGRARMVLCASGTQHARFQKSLPGHAEKIHHFPNAVRREWISSTSIKMVEKGTVGYVGNMGERVDWQLVHDTAYACPQRRFIFVGGLEPTPGRKVIEWAVKRDRALALPNVVVTGRVPQAEVWRHYQSFEIGWMPYDSHHPFNIASCPTKIFDALAAGRPFVSTPVPECLLYSEHIPIINSAANATDIFAQTLADWTTERSARQLDFARANDWHARARWLLGKLEDLST